MSGKLLNYRLLLVLAVIIPLSCVHDSVTFDSLLAEMTDRESLTRFPSNLFTLRQFSSYNRESVAPDKPGWFANYDMSHFIRVEKNHGRREFVLFDADGPGAVVRWWMTFYKAQNGILRVYIDNDTSAIIQGKPADLLRGNLIASSPLAVAVQEGAPLGEEGRDYDHNFYVPLPFSGHCKITYECDSLVMRYENEGVKVPQGYWWPDVFYNIDYRSYSRDVMVRSVTKSDLESGRTKLDKAGQQLLANNVHSPIAVSFDRVIPAGDSMVIEVKGGRKAISRLSVDLEAGNLPQALRSVVIQASFDGNRTIWVPVGEFFGTGYSPVAHRTWMNQADENGHMESRWLMPFRSGCFLTFLNYGADTVHISGTAGLAPYKWKPESMYFASSWHEYYKIRSRDTLGSPYDLNFIDIKGKGVYAGDQVTLFNNSWQWWGEGDEKIFVDDDTFPSSFGTGSEDYYGYSFGRQESFSHPFLSQPVGTGDMAAGPVVNMRHRSLDAIPFRDSVRSDIELWHWADIRMNYALTTFYYILPPYATNIRPDPESVRHKVVLSKIDFTLEEN